MHPFHDCRELVATPNSCCCLGAPPRTKSTGSGSYTRRTRCTTCPEGRRSKTRTPCTCAALTTRAARRRPICTEGRRVPRRHPQTTTLVRRTRKRRWAPERRPSWCQGWCSRRRRPAPDCPRSRSSSRRSTDRRLHRPPPPRRRNASRPRRTTPSRT